MSQAFEDGSGNLWFDDLSRSAESISRSFSPEQVQLSNSRMSLLRYPESFEAKFEQPHRESRMRSWDDNADTWSHNHDANRALIAAKLEAEEALKAALRHAE